jgi:hypothetical protein
MAREKALRAARPPGRLLDTSPENDKGKRKIVFEPSENDRQPGTRLTFTEQGVHLDGVHGPGPQAAAGREEGTAGLLDAIGALLVAAVSKETV